MVRVRYGRGTVRYHSIVDAFYLAKRFIKDRRSSKSCCGWLQIPLQLLSCVTGELISGSEGMAQSSLDVIAMYIDRMNPMTAKAATGNRKYSDLSRMSSPQRGSCTVLALAVSASILVSDCTSGSSVLGCGIDGGGMTLFSSDGTTPASSSCSLFCSGVWVSVMPMVLDRWRRQVVWRAGVKAKVVANVAANVVATRKRLSHNFIVWVVLLLYGMVGGMVVTCMRWLLCGSFGLWQ